MKNKKGFTLVELLAVIVILGVIMTIAVPSVIKTIRTSKEKTRFNAAKEIVGISEVYFAANSEKTEVLVTELYNYLESDATNPQTGNNDLKTSGTSHIICKDDDYSEQGNFLDNDGNGYRFDGYYYSFTGNCE